MADKGKGSEKSKPKSSGGDEGGGGSSPIIDAIFWILLVLVAFSVLKGVFSSFGFSFALPSAAAFFEFVFNKVQIYSVFLSLVFFIGIIYFNFKLGELAHQSHHRIHGHGGHSDNHPKAHDQNDNDAPIPHFDPSPMAHSVAHSTPAFSEKHTQNKRWEMVQSRLTSMNEGDWRLSVIEADIILNDMLQKMGLPGAGVAEKLKSASKSNFHTLDDAWQAHKLRNRIAHEGASFHLTQEDAKQTVLLYKKVFDEFYFI